MPKLKKWDDLTQHQKVDDLRREILRILDAINQLSPNVNQIRSFALETSSQLKDVAKAVEDLEAQLPKPPSKKKKT